MTERQTFAVGETIRQRHLDAVDAMSDEIARLRAPMTDTPGTLEERLNSHMGKADMQEVLADCRLAAVEIASLRARVEVMREAFPADVRAVLDVMGDEMAYPAAYIAADASEESGLSITPARVSAIRKALHTFGLASFGSLFDDDSAYVKGRGYWLSGQGVRAREALKDTPDAE